MDEFDNLQSAKLGGSSSTTLFLGLFLLVLAFFILLVSISTVETVKSKKVMKSLSSTFTDLTAPVTDPTDFVSKHGEVLGPEAFQEQLTGVFSTAINVDRVKIVRPGQEMRVDLQARELFEEDKPKVRPARYDMIDRIVASLSAAPVGMRYEMVFQIGSAVDADGMLPTRQVLEMARAGAFARSVTERGAPPHAVSVGLMVGNSNDVAISFYTRDEASARLEFGELDKARGSDAEARP